MTAALIFRGHAFRVPNDGYSSRQWGVDWRLCIESQYKFLVESLVAKYGWLDIILCTYTTEFDARVNKEYLADVWRMAMPGMTQRQTALMAIDAAIERIVSYDFVVMTRFDLEFLATPWEQPGFVEGKVNFLWREWNEASWNHHRRVPDAIHMLPGKYLNDFRAAVAETPSEVCLHQIYNPLARRIGEENLNIMNPEGFHDSNTDWEPNPIYKMRRVM